jgi:hypothetical protein
MDVLKDTYNVLYVDDEENNLNSFKAALRRNYNVYTALSGIEGMEVLANALEKKSKAAEESAFIIARELQAPVASVLGLINLIMKSELSEEVRTIVTHLEATAEKLNTVVRNITQAIERGDR